MSHMDDMAQAVLVAARSKGVMIATAESCTGGMIAAALTEIPGSSSVVDRGFVTYSNAAKVDMLDVQEVTLNRFGAVSEEVAREMAEGALRASQAALSVSVTGIAGPGGSEHKPEGRVCFGLAQHSVETQTLLMDFGPKGRSNVRQMSVQTAFELILEALKTT